MHHEWESINQEIAALIPPAAQAREKVVQRIEQIESAPYCNGSLRWRTGDPVPTDPEEALHLFSTTDTVKSVLYIDHTAGVPCPVHGIHDDPSKRLQKYIGVKRAKVVETITLVYLGQRLERAKAALTSIDNMIAQINTHTRILCDTLRRITIIAE